MIIMYWPILACSVFLLNALLVAGETGCPQRRDIAPCTCTGDSSVRLTCSNLINAGVLQKVFANSQRYTFDQVYLKNCVFSSIPSEIFQKVTVKELYLENSVLQTLFSELEAQNNDIYKIEMKNTVVARKIAEQDLTQFVNLKVLNVFNSIIPTLSKDFGDGLPENMKKVFLKNTGTQSISKGTLNHVPNLDDFAVENGNLKTLSRDVFPRPFNGRILSFNGNRITKIAKDLFTDMPNLDSLSMMSNGISVIPETAFEGRTLSSLEFEGNPLQCDCQLLWLIKDKPAVLGGRCAGPQKFAGRELQDLMPNEFSC